MHESDSPNSKSRRRHRREPPHSSLPPASSSSSYSHSRLSWCCTFAAAPDSPDYFYDGSKTHHSVSARSKILHYPAPKKTEVPPKSTHSSFPNSPQSQGSATSSSATRLGLRRILSPGRVSPIDEPALPPKHARIPPAGAPKSPLPEDLDARRSSAVAEEEEEEVGLGDFDVRLNLKGRNGGGSLILELSSAVLASSSAVFAGLIADYRKKSRGLCRIEVPEVVNLTVFRETIELMFVEDIARKLLNFGVCRAIDILEV